VAGGSWEARRGRGGGAKEEVEEAETLAAAAKARDDGMFLVC